ncbi:MAG: helix-turn-helix transcriptional regulator [Clostridia bacterium]|jgi:transcriptional regulator with XRE-family HTH domain|nr:helix-turn-helix transcriptional regulator [Clostridia bacterium]
MLKIRELREEKHLTQIEMALNLGVSRQVYANWENEINQPELKMIIILADFFGVTTDYLLGRTDDLGAVTSVPVFPQFSEEDREVLSLFHALTPEYRAVALKTLRSWAGVPATGVSKKKA